MEKAEILKALAEFQKNCPELALNSNVNVKTKTGGQYSFKYANLPYIMETIQQTLSENDLILSFDFPENIIRLTIYHTSGQSISSQLPIKLTDSPQENGSLITYYRRYLITSLLNLTADKDDDGNTFEQQDRDISAKSPENWLNVNPTKTSKSLTLDFIRCWELINLEGGKITDVRDLFKVSKDTESKLKDAKFITVLSEDNFNKTLDGTLTQINAVLNSFAMNKEYRSELEGIIKDAEIQNTYPSENELKNG